MNLKNLFVTMLLGFSVSGCGPTIVAGVGHGSAALSEDGRTFGSMIDDSSIVIEIDSLFSRNDKISEGSHINIVSINGIVLLTGETPAIETRNNILDIVRSVKGVKRTVNEIRIINPSSLSARSNDSWLTSKVKTKLVYDQRIDSTRIKVVTENKSVFLLGLISRAEAEYATEAVRAVSGIKRVVILFEYTE